MSLFGIDIDKIDFLGVGNPLATPVGQKIEEATDSSLPSEDWAKNIEVCDLINSREDGSRDAVRAIRKRLLQNAGKNNAVIMHTLTLLETCVKNCDRRFHTLVCSKDFVQDLIKIIGPRNDPPAVVQEKVLALIQNWADAFRNQPDMKGVVEVYSELKSKGIEFPPTDMDSMVPISTPQRSVPVQKTTPTPPQNRPVYNNVSPASPPQAQVVKAEVVAKLRSELDVVETNITVFSEMMQELKPGKESGEDWQLMQDLYGTCRQMQRRLKSLLNRVANEELTGLLLKLNDDLNNLFLRYERYEKKRAALLGNPLSPPKPSDIQPSGVSLIDFGEEVTATPASAVPANLSSQLEQLDLGSPSTSSQMRNITGVSALAGDALDDFDSLAKSRAVVDSPKRTPSTYRDNLEPDHLNISLGAATQLRHQPLPSDEDAREIEAWLSSQEGTEVSQDMEAYLRDHTVSQPPFRSSGRSDEAENALL